MSREMSHAARYKNEGSTLDKRRSDRMYECENIRKRKREEELQRMRDNLAMNDEGEEDENVDLFHPDLIAKMFSDNDADRVSALKIYGKEIGKCSPAVASSTAIDMEELGVVNGLIESLSKWPLDSEVFAQVVQALLRIVKTVDDKYEIAGWLDDVILSRFAEVCHPSFALAQPSNAEVVKTTLTVLNYMMVGNEEFFLICASHNFHCNVMQIFQQRLFSGDEFDGTQALPFLKMQLIFLNVFYNEALDVGFYDNINDYWCLLLALIRHAFDCLDLLAVDEGVARSQPNGPSAGGDGVPPAATRFVEQNFVVNLSLAEEALFSMSHLLMNARNHMKVKLAEMPQFSDHIRLLLRFCELFYARYAALGARCRRSISSFFKAIFFHVAELSQYEVFRHALATVEIVVKLWEVLFHVVRFRFVGSDAGVVIDPVDVDTDGTFDSCVLTIRDSMIACLSNEINGEAISAEMLHTYASMFSEQVHIAQFAVRKEALMAIRILLIYGNEAVVKLVVTKGVIYPICDMLTVMDVEVVLGALDCIREIMLKDGVLRAPLRFKPQDLPPVTYRQLMEEAGVIDKLDFLMHSPNAEVFEVASSIHADFFDRSTTEEEEVFSAAPPRDSAAQSSSSSQLCQL